MRSHGSGARAAISCADAVAATASSRSANDSVRCPETRLKSCAITSQSTANVWSIRRRYRATAAAARYTTPRGAATRCNRERCGCSEPKTREVGTLVTSGRCQRAQFERRWSRFSRGELWRTNCTPESRDLESIISRISAGWLRLRGWTASRPTCCSVDYLNLPRVCRTFPPHAARRSPWQGERSSTSARLRSVPGSRGVDPRSCTV